MQRPIRSALAATLALLGALTLATTASAHDDRDQHARPPVHGYAQPAWRPSATVVISNAPVMVAQPQWGYAQAGGFNACGAPRWNGEQRYMPGQVVRRHGQLYVATDVSAVVWNENSPPEWTPSYWVPAVCR